MDVPNDFWTCPHHCWTHVWCGWSLARDLVRGLAEFDSHWRILLGWLFCTDRGFFVRSI